jgi:hypothetical protein
MKDKKKYSEVTEEKGSMIFSKKYSYNATKNFPSRFAVGEVVRLQFHGNNGGIVVGIIKRVIFESIKVRYDVLTLNGGVFEGVYSQRILPLDEEWENILNKKENKNWVENAREDMTKV